MPHEGGPFVWRDERDIPPRTSEEQARYASAAALDGDVRPRGSSRTLTNDDYGADANCYVEPEPEPEPFVTADLSAWGAIVPRPKAFVLPPFLPRDDVVILTGDGGTNKSTWALQACACAAASKPMLGTDITASPALYVTAEDDDRENHWRLAKIATSIGTTLEHLAGRLFIASLRGRLNNELATFDGDGRLRTAPAYRMLRATIEATGAKLVALDNVAHLYAGNENDRSQVTAFINLLYQLCGDFGVTILLIAHRNKAGADYSGSTAWLNAVRSQILIERDDNDPDLRRLTLGKANYARQGEELQFRWHDFALVRDEDLPTARRDELAAIGRANGDNTAFLACLRQRTSEGEGRFVGPAPGPNYAPTQFEGMPQAKGLKRDRLKAAMDRLFAIGAIEVHTYRNVSKARDVTIIREVSGGAFPNPELPPRTAPEHYSRTTPNSPPEPPRTHTPLLRKGGGAAHEGPARPLAGAAMILAPGETGDDVDLGMGG